jgi:hypothetical protein
MLFVRLATLSCLLCFGAACATGSQRSASRCDVISLAEIVAQPLMYAGKTYCGTVYIRRVDNTVRILQRKDEQPSSDFALLVTISGQSLLGRLGAVPRRFRIEATVDPQADCFRPRSDDPNDDESCSPFAHPIFFQLHSARPAP